MVLMGQGTGWLPPNDPPQTPPLWIHSRVQLPHTLTRGWLCDNRVQQEGPPASPRPWEACGFCFPSLAALSEEAGARSLWMRGPERPQPFRIPHRGPRGVSEATLDPSATGWLWTQGTRLTPHRTERNCPYHSITAPALIAELWANEWLLF